MDMRERISSLRILLLVIASLFLSNSVLAQKSSVSVSGTIKDKVSNETLPFVNIVLKKSTDSSFVSGTITNDNGLFTIADAKPGDYLLEVTYIGYRKYSSPVFIGSNSEFIDLGTILLEEDVQQLDEVVVTAQQDAVAGAMDKKNLQRGR
jgi:hypothetical protein